MDTTLINSVEPQTLHAHKLGMRRVVGSFQVTLNTLVSLAQSPPAFPSILLGFVEMWLFDIEELHSMEETAVNI